MSQDLAIKKLRNFNIIAGVLHFAQMCAVLALANDFSLPVVARYMSGPPGTTYAQPVTLFNTHIGYAVAGFLALSSIAHFVVASPTFFARYSQGLIEKHNYFRWVEYALSSSIMMVLIAQVCGMTEVTALLAIFGVNASMILFGWLQEKYERPSEGGWLPFIFGCIAGIVPWLAVLLYIVAPGATHDSKPPTFVYAIVISLFLFFNVFAVVQFLQYRARGRWADYLVGERSYIVLSLVAKSLLAWQIFAGTLIK